ncbi:MAG: hypothetical protein II817_01710 [Bacteroidales bacterium]|nr:hypothetical protein [Bacteroidales bacterium]
MVWKLIYKWIEGEKAHPIFKYLTEQVPTEEVHGLKDKATMALVDSLSRSEGRKDGKIRWNFTKFLISKDGSGGNGT